MSDDDNYPIYQLLKDDPRYPLEAYRFIREALAFAQEILNMGEEAHPEPSLDLEGSKSQTAPEKHLSGQQLCEAIRVYAVEQFGFMAKTVLNNWGMYSTSDFGEIVYNLINIGWMKKSSRDRRDHFDDVYDFEQAFVQDFQITVPDQSQSRSD